MANVGFKKGTQSNLNILMEQPLQIEDGTFYLTTDTHRLYIGQTINSTKTIVPVNQGINIVEYISEEDDNYQTDGTVLPTTVEQGQFYYVSNANILCIGSGEHWVQINPPVKNQEIAAIVNTEITNQLNLLNPMRYMGIAAETDIYDSTTNPTGIIKNNAEWGLVYKAAANFTLPANLAHGGAAINVKIGDLLISQTNNVANANEGDPNNTVWAIIPSGDDVLTWGSF